MAENKREIEVICSILDKLPRENVLAVLTFANTMYHMSEAKEVHAA